MGEGGGHCGSLCSVDLASRVSKPGLRCGPGQAAPPLLPWDPSCAPPPGLLHSLISPGRAAQRGWGRAGVSQDSWLTGPPWDSGLDPGVREAGDTGAVTVGPQIPHPVAPALVSGWGAGGGRAPGASRGWALSWGRRGAGQEAVRSPWWGVRDFPSSLCAGHCAGH